MKDNEKNIISDNYVDDMKKAIGYSLTIMILMWIISLFIG